MVSAHRGAINQVLLQQTASTAPCWTGVAMKSAPRVPERRVVAIGGKMTDVHMEHTAPVVSALAALPLWNVGFAKTYSFPCTLSMLL